MLASPAVLAAVTGAIELLKPHVPVLSLAVLYLFAVLPIAVVWGTWFGVGVGELPGIDIRVVADRADRPEATP